MPISPIGSSIACSYTDSKLMFILLGRRLILFPFTRLSGIWVQSFGLGSSCMLLCRSVACDRYEFKPIREDRS